MVTKKELIKVITYDLELLKDCFLVQNKRGFNYHYKLLKGNLTDLKAM